MAIESGKLVKVEIVLKVPVGMPMDPREWALNCVSVVAAGVPHLATINATVGALTPNPAMIAPV